MSLTLLKLARDLLARLRVLRRRETTHAPPVGPSYAGEGPTPARAKTTLARGPR